MNANEDKSLRIEERPTSPYTRFQNAKKKETNLKRRRSPVTYNDVVESAESLDESGIAVTIARVRRDIGGAAETVTAHLKRWRASKLRPESGADRLIPLEVKAALAQAFAAQRELTAVLVIELENARKVIREQESELKRLRAAVHNLNALQQ